MSFIDLFSWFVLAALIGILVAVFVTLGMTPRHIARERGHPLGRGRDGGRLGRWSAADRATPSHVIRRVLLRQVAILNYVNPY